MIQVYCTTEMQIIITDFMSCEIFIVHIPYAS